jgi:uncharacterized membrane-anchored protein
MTFLANTSVWTNIVSYLPVGIFAGIALGVIGKYFYDYAVKYFKASDKSRVAWDWKGFFITIILSLIMGFLLYGFVLEKVARLNDFWLIFSASGQAGFFSQSLIGELGKKYV